MTAREFNCEKFKMSYSEFKGLVNKLGNYGRALPLKAQVPLKPKYTYTCMRTHIY